MGTTADIARAIHEKHSNGGKVPTYFEEFVSDVLSELRASGRLVPAGGMALAAEEWADFLNVIHEGRGDYSSRDRLREKFPTIAPVEAATQSAGGDCFDVCGGHPAPAEPAEKETKAQRCPSEIEGWGCSLTSGHDGDHTAYDQDGSAYVWPASSPVVPAPTETEWQTWQEVPEGVQYYGINGWGPTYYVNRGGVRYRVFDDTPSKTADYVVQNFAPFVAAEEG
ncbi:hypothetical protein [Rhodococcus sp. ARP2]|uniref:hypothetical protein n=1 Tax=Rhodococcus sp. ARP2 TaxID=1661385 RepID=UPI00064BC0D2|nr:hypothetical protein [Rhodococcus sp. ARP2]